MIGGVKITADSFVFIGDFVVTGKKLPFEVRLNLNNKAMIFEVSLKIVNGGLNDPTIRQEMVEVLFLRMVDLLADGNDSLLLEFYQGLV